MRILLKRSFIVLFVSCACLSHALAQENYLEEVKFGATKIVRGTLETIVSLTALCEKYPELVSGVSHVIQGDSNTVYRNNSPEITQLFPNQEFSDSLGTCPLNPPHVLNRSTVPNKAIPTDLIGFRSCDFKNSTGKKFFSAAYTTMDASYAIGRLELDFCLKDVSESTSSLILAGTALYGALEILTGTSIILTSSVNHSVSMVWSWIHNFR